MGWSWVRESSRARHAAANSALPDEPPPAPPPTLQHLPPGRKFGIVSVKACSLSRAASRTVRGVDNPRELVDVY